MTMKLQAFASLVVKVGCKEIVISLASWGHSTIDLADVGITGLGMWS